MPSTIRNLNELTAVATNDYLLINDTSDVLDQDKRISLTNLQLGVAKKSGTPVAGRVARWLDANTVEDGGFAVSDISRLSQAQTFSALKTFNAGLSLGNESLTSYREALTWVPTLDGSTGTPSYTVGGTTIGNYTRIGNVVIYSVFFQTVTISGGSGVIRISLPVTVGAGSTPKGTVQPQNIVLDAGYTWLTANPVAGTTYMLISQCGTNIASISLPITALSNNDFLTASGFYFV